jgi:hypothetical protein
MRHNAIIDGLDEAVELAVGRAGVTIARHRPPFVRPASFAFVAMVKDAICASLQTLICARMHMRISVIAKPRFPANMHRLRTLWP